MKRSFVFALVATLSVNAYSQCVGTGAIKTCFDSSGNSYTINKLGNSTFVNGSNSGGSWSSITTRTGSSVLQSGSSLNGRSWNQSIHGYSGGSSVFGSDSDGRSVNSTCTGFGCY